MSPAWLVAAAWLVAVTGAVLAARDAVSQAGVAAGEHRKALVAEFRRALVVTVPLSAVAVPLAWWMVSMSTLPVGVPLR